jgi:hypothetical protein
MTIALLLATALAAAGTQSRFADGIHAVTLDWTSPEATPAPDADLVLPPNRTLKLCVEHDEGTLITINATGEQGLVAPAIATANRAGGGARTPPPTVTTCKSYAPFKVGPVTLKITQTSSAAGGPRLLLSAADRDRLSRARSLTEGTAAWSPTVAAWHTPTDATATDPRAAHLLALTDRLVAAVAVPNPGLPPIGSPGYDAAKAAKDAREAQISAVAALITAEATAIDKALRTDPAILRAESVTMLVETLQTGALGMGLAGIAGASTNTWAATKPPGADVTQITRTGGGRLDAELVVSYTQFLSPIPSSSDRFRGGVSFALGVADLTELEITSLRSAYLGADFGWRNLSVGPALVVRRVDRLATGSTVGAAVTSDADIGLRTVWKPGFALVVNARLDLLGVKTRKPEAG